MNPLGEGRGCQNGEVALTLNFSVDIKRPRWDYSALRVARPFAHAYVTLYIWTMNAGIFRPLLLVAVYVSVMRLRRLRIRPSCIFPRGVRRARRERKRGCRREMEEKRRKQDKKKIYIYITYVGTTRCRVFSLDRLRARTDWNLAEQDGGYVVVRVLRHVTGGRAFPFSLSLLLRMRNYFRSGKSGFRAGGRLMVV